MLNGKRITLVAAMGRNRAIGHDGALPWHLPRELKHFRDTTMGHPIVMGRLTWLSIGRALPGRQNIVVSRDPAFSAPGCAVAGSLEEAVALAQDVEVMIIGGGQLYAAAMPAADRMVLTQVDCAPEADTWFPEWDEADWYAVDARAETADADNPFAYRVVDLRRR
ncbi:MAG: dihydrofolate reductase [Xanthomonadales bacterium]